jgi:hypothetical protein
MRRQIILTLAIGLIAWVEIGMNQALAAVKITKNKEFLIVEHPHYTLQLEPENSGAGKFIKLSGIEKLQPGADKEISLFKECFSQNDMEGKAPPIKFSAEIKKINDTVSTITFKTKLDENVAGRDLAGAILERKMVFDDAKPYVQIDETLINPTKQSIFYALVGIRNCFFLGNDGFESTWMPTSMNVLSINRRDGKALGYYAKQEWEYAPVEGWIGVCNNRKHGIAFVFDYNVLESLYSSGRNGVFGWFADGGQLLPGKEFKTSYLVVLTTSFNGYTSANDKLIANLDVVKKDNKLIIDNTIIGLKESGEIKVNTEVYGVRTHKTVKQPELKIDKLGLTPVVKRLKASGFDEPVVVRVKVTGENLDCSYEKYVENGFRAQPIPYLQLAAEYRRKAPAKIVEKAEDSNFASPISKEKRALLFFGMYTQWYKFDQILDGWKIGVFNVRPAKTEYLGELEKASELPNLKMKVEKFKNSFFDYSLIILSDVTLEALPRPVIIKLKFYLESGGKLLVLGGPYAYGEGNYHGKGLDDILPVASSDFDLKWQKKGEVFRKAKDHQITQNINFESKPMAYWIHKIKVKKDAEVLVNAGEFCPLIVSGKYGKGKVICFTGTPLGVTADDKQLPFWKWDGWVPLMKNTINWLTKAETTTSN